MPPRTAPRRVALLLALAFALAGCEASTRQYERGGTAGAVMVLVGAVATPVGMRGISRRDERTGRQVAAVGTTLQITGLILAIWALDGLISSEPLDPRGE